MNREFSRPVNTERPALTPDQRNLVIAESFKQATYPLTEAGKQLNQQVQWITDIRDPQQLEALRNICNQLPTVENPHPELYVPLDIGPDDDELLGFDLDVVSITKGCTHGCEHCIVNAKQLRKEDIMPFPAVLQIAEQKRKFEERVATHWRDWYNVTEHERSVLKEIENTTGADRKRLIEGLQASLRPKFLAHPISKHISEFGLVIPREPDFMRTVFVAYDAEPSDYRDTSFRHQDGSPADWGDAFVALASDLRPISITSAGWALHNRTATRGAEKIAKAVHENPKLLLRLGISINPYDELYKRDPAAYVQSMKQVIQILGSLGPRLWCRSERGVHDEFDKTVIGELAEFYRSQFIDNGGILPARRKENFELIWHRQVSHFSGRAYQAGHESDPDTMNVSAGRHVWPNGQVAFRSYNERRSTMIFDNRSIQMSGNKGERPQPTGQSIFTIR